MIAPMMMVNLGNKDISQGAMVNSGKKFKKLLKARFHISGVAAAMATIGNIENRNV